MATILVVVRIGTWYYVITTWESGEVVELAIDTSNRAHTARLWDLDTSAYPTVYYDAEPEVAMSLLTGKPLQITRADAVSTRAPKTTQADALLGTPRDRVPVVANLIEE